MNWAIVNYLPDVGNCKVNFQTIVASYILAIHKHLRNEMDGFAPGETPVRRRRASQTPRRQHSNPVMISTASYAKELVHGALTQDLFLLVPVLYTLFPKTRSHVNASMNAYRIIQQLDKKYPAYVPPSADSPVYSFLLETRKNKPALEFVKAIHRVS